MNRSEKYGRYNVSRNYYQSVNDKGSLITIDDIISKVRQGDTSVLDRLGIGYNTDYNSGTITFKFRGAEYSIPVSNLRNDSDRLNYMSTEYKTIEEILEILSKTDLNKIDQACQELGLDDNKYSITKTNDDIAKLIAQGYERTKDEDIFVKDGKYYKREATFTGYRMVEIKPEK